MHEKNLASAYQFFNLRRKLLNLRRSFINFRWKIIKFASQIKEFLYMRDKILVDAQVNSAISSAKV